MTLLWHKYGLRKAALKLLGLTADIIYVFQAVYLCLSFSSSLHNFVYVTCTMVYRIIIYDLYSMETAVLLSVDILPYLLCTYFKKIAVAVSLLGVAYETTVYCLAGDVLWNKTIDIVNTPL